MKRTPLLPLLWFALASPLVAQAATTYLQDFNGHADGTMSLGDGSVIISFDDAARVYSGGLQLTTDGYGDELANYIIPGLDGAADGWSARFRFSISSASAPADGFAFGWGAGLGSAVEIAGWEDGWGAGENHLFFGFDLWDNGGGEWGLLAGGGDGTDDLVFANTPGTLVGESGSVTGEAFIRWDPMRGFSFRTTGLATNIDVTDVPTPGIAASDSNAFAFVARTGALTSTIVLDDVWISSVPEPGVASLGALAGALVVLHRRRTN
jgi:hypothetical protein